MDISIRLYSISYYIILYCFTRMDWNIENFMFKIIAQSSGCACHKYIQDHVCFVYSIIKSYNETIAKESRALCYLGYPSETPLKTNSHGISFAHRLLIRYSVVLKFCTENGNNTAMICANFKTIGKLKEILWSNRISRDLGLWWVSEWYPTLHSTNPHACI